MRIYPPGTMSPRESLERRREWEARATAVRVSDDALRAYVGAFFASFHATLERFSPDFAPHIFLYARQPFETFILRLGEHGTIIGHRPAERTGITIQRPEDLDPPLETVNIFDVVARWGRRSPPSTSSSAPTTARRPRRVTWAWRWGMPSSSSGT